MLYSIFRYQRTGCLFVNDHISSVVFIDCFSAFQLWSSFLLLPPSPLSILHLFFLEGWEGGLWGWGKVNIPAPERDVTRWITAPSKTLKYLSESELKKKQRDGETEALSTAEFQGWTPPISTHFRSISTQCGPLNKSFDSIGHESRAIGLCKRLITSFLLLWMSWLDVLANLGHNLHIWGGKFGCVSQLKVFVAFWTILDVSCGKYISTPHQT